MGTAPESAFSGQTQGIQNLKCATPEGLGPDRAPQHPPPLIIHGALDLSIKVAGQLAQGQYLSLIMAYSPTCQSNT